MTSRFRPAAPFVIAALLSACAAQPETAAPPPETSAPAPPPSRATVAALPAAPSVPLIEVPAPSEILGWSPDQVADAFGPATLIRREREAEIWQYQTNGCVLFVFMYPDGGGHSVRHLDARGGATTETCLTNVVRAAG